MTADGKRIKRERTTLQAMLALYCRAHHGGHDTICGECAALRDYALARLERCPHGENKPTCRQCPIHCYSPERRAEIVRVMRYSGPRLLLRRPGLALAHLWDELRAGKVALNRKPRTKTFPEGRNKRR